MPLKDGKPTHFLSATGTRAPAERTPALSRRLQPGRPALHVRLALDGLSPAQQAPCSLRRLEPEAQSSAQEPFTWSSRRTAAHCFASSNTAARAPKLGWGRNSRRIPELIALRTATRHNCFSTLQIIKPERRRIKIVISLNQARRGSPLSVPGLIASYPPTKFAVFHSKLAHNYPLL